jgi:uncharacterized protein YutE (UPF0331/DUF86 family)
MMLKYKAFGRAQSYYEAIDTLGEYGILPREFAYNYAKIASFRNVLAHVYETVDKAIICKEALQKLDDIRTYLEYIKQAL